jgi:hypothetical protein
MARRASQAPVLKTANDEIYAMVLTEVDRLVKVEFPIRKVNPLTLRRRTPVALKVSAQRCACAAGSNAGAGFHQRARVAG